MIKTQEHWNKCLQDPFLVLSHHPSHQTRTKGTRTTLLICHQRASLRHDGQSEMLSVSALTERAQGKSVVPQRVLCETDKAGVIWEDCVPTGDKRRKPTSTRFCEVYAFFCALMSDKIWTMKLASSCSEDFVRMLQSPNFQFQQNQHLAQRASHSRPSSAPTLSPPVKDAPTGKGNGQA